jgi:tRNA A37 threonylcarbamoyladenosine dehydratase
VGARVHSAVVTPSRFPETAPTSISRLTNQAEFTGPPPKGNGIIVTDFVAYGSAIANLRGYLLHHGCTVAFASSLCAEFGSARIAPDPFTVQALKKRFRPQLAFLTTTLGLSKVVALEQRIALIHPDCQVTAVEEFITPENCAALLSVQADAVIDACDQMTAKQAMSVWALASHTPFITVGAAGGKRLPHKVDVADLADVTHDPLLSQLRQRLRKQHAGPVAGKPMGIAAVFSKESVTPSQVCDAQTDSSLNCHGYGSVVTVTATFGNCAAAWVLDLLSKKSTL